MTIKFKQIEQIQEILKDITHESFQRYHTSTADTQKKKKILNMKKLIEEIVEDKKEGNYRQGIKLTAKEENT